MTEVDAVAGAGCNLYFEQYEMGESSTIASKPWNNWYHCNGNTYGTWLRGDPRGFRERHHRRHVEGDYRNPPPTGTYDEVLYRSQKLMKQGAIELDASQRTIAANEMVSRLLRDGIELLALAVDDHHFHALGRFPDHRPKHWMGRAKMHASMELREHGLPGTVWARGSRALPIKDRSHQLNVFRYIARHENRKAAVWTFRKRDVL